MSQRQPTIAIGPWTKGEIPPTLAVTFTDSLGNKIDLTGYTAQWIYRQHTVSGGFAIASTDPAKVTRSAVINADQVNHKGEADYTWVAGDFTTAGDFEGNMWVTAAGGTPIYASSRYAWTIFPDLA